MSYTIDDEIRSAGRELGMRRNKYPQWVAQGKMKPEQAQMEIAVMERIYARLKGIKEHGETIEYLGKTIHNLLELIHAESQGKDVDKDWASSVIHHGYQAVRTAGGG